MRPPPARHFGSSGGSRRNGDDGVRWVKDTTGRFPERPHYDLSELEAECEVLVERFLTNRHGSVSYPISTDDLVLMLEKEVESLDVYFEFEEEETWGETLFRAGRIPEVRISRRLSENARFENPYRTTLTHEFGHVHFHGFLFEMGSRQEKLFSSESHHGGDLGTCRRSGIESPRKYDWAEWQAAYASGAILMPRTALKRMVATLSHTGVIALDALAPAVSAHFRVSVDAARVRLSQLGYGDRTPPEQVRW